MEEIVNRVANSGLLSLDLEDWLPAGPFKEIDLKPILFHGMILREQDLKDYFSNLDLNEFKGSFLNVHCSEDVILPQWIYLFISSKLNGVCQKVVWGSKTDLLNAILIDCINNLDPSEFSEQRIVIKGCSSVEVYPSVYTSFISKVQPVAKSIMYGEACSTVPIYKRPKV